MLSRTLKNSSIMRTQVFSFLFGLLGVFSMFTATHARTKLEITPQRLTSIVDYYEGKSTEQEIGHFHALRSWLGWSKKTVTTYEKIISSPIPPLRDFIESINHLKSDIPTVMDASSDKIMTVVNELGKRPRPKPPSPKPGPSKRQVVYNAPPPPSRPLTGVVEDEREPSCETGSSCNNIISMVTDKETKQQL